MRHGAKRGVQQAAEKARTESGAAMIGIQPKNNGPAGINDSWNDPWIWGNKTLVSSTASDQFIRSGHRVRSSNRPSNSYQTPLCFQLAFSFIRLQVVRGRHGCQVFSGCSHDCPCGSRTVYVQRAHWSAPPPELECQELTWGISHADMLFQGEGEAFNVR